MKRILVLLIAITIILSGCSSKTAEPVSNTEQKSGTVSKPNTEQIQEDQLPTFTLAELRQYNGTNGKVYVGFQGKVLDVTGVKGFTSGPASLGHKILYGKDVTAIMYLSPHGAGVLKSSSVKVVGKLAK